MNNSIIAEGKTTAEAIENGLKELKVSKDKVNVKVLENTEKRSFFSILAPRIVKVELTLKENRQAPIMEIQPEQIEQAKQNIITFLNDFSKKFEDLNYNIEIKENNIVLELMGKDANRLIGYRGETLNALQTIITIISNKELTIEFNGFPLDGVYVDKLATQMLEYLYSDDNAAKVILDSNDYDYFMTNADTRGFTEKGYTEDTPMNVKTKYSDFLTDYGTNS